MDSAGFEVPSINDVKHVGLEWQPIRWMSTTPSFAEETAAYGVYLIVVQCSSA